MLIILWNDFINKIKISEIKYDSAKRRKRIAIYVGVFFLCMLFMGGAYGEARILVDNSEYGTFLALIIKVVLLIFLIISSLLGMS